MKVLTATIKQKKALEGNYLNNSQLKFVLDSDGNYIVGLGVLTDPDYVAIREDLFALNQIEYVIPVEN